MKSCISKNSKTGISVDFTTDCPKRRSGKACKYCYVESARNMHYNAKTVCDYLPYKNEVLRFPKEKIDMLNSLGGIRLFSFGDYMKQHDSDIQKFLSDCILVGLKVKAITKQYKFVIKYANHPAINMIHVSVDNIGDGVNHILARALRFFNKNVKIRSVIMKDEDINALKFSDVYTLNHARGMKQYGYKLYHRKDIKQLNEKLNGKVCCETGNCLDCKLKCATI